MEEIRVEIEISDLPSPLNFDSWGDYIYKRLSEAGFPITKDGNILRGELVRYDGPKDFNKTIYIWRG
jgi:hypothetical protein